MMGMLERSLREETFRGLNSIEMRMFNSAPSVWIWKESTEKENLGKWKSGITLGQAVGDVKGNEWA